MAKRSTDSTEVYETTKESVEQGQLPRAAEPDQCVLKVKTQRESVAVGFTHSRRSVYEKASDDLRWRRQDSDLEDASLDRTDVSAEAGIDKVLENHNNGAVAVTGPKEVTEVVVQVGCDWLDERRLGV